MFFAYCNRQPLNLRVWLIVQVEIFRGAPNILKSFYALFFMINGACIKQAGISGFKIYFYAH